MKNVANLLKERMRLLSALVIVIVVFLLDLIMKSISESFNLSKQLNLKNPIKPTNFRFWIVFFQPGF